MVFGLFKDKDMDELARTLAAELGRRAPPATLVKPGEKARAAIPKALEMLADSVASYRRTHGLNVLKQIRLSKAFQDQLAEMGYEDDFIREATLRLAQGFAAK